MTPTEAELLATVEAELRARGRPFSRAALMAFVSSVMPLAQDNPDARFWASQFLEAGAAATVPD
jgi:hypothetical protein